MGQWATRGLGVVVWPRGGVGLVGDSNGPKTGRRRPKRGPATTQNGHVAQSPPSQGGRTRWGSSVKGFGAVFGDVGPFSATLVHLTGFGP